MLIAGKLVAGAIGLLTGGWVGLIIGLIIGHSFDRGLARPLGAGSPEKLAQVQESFFRTSFLLLGHLAKADGRISQNEIDHTESIIRQMQLDRAGRQRAIDLFRQGAAPDFDLSAALTDFNAACGGQALIRQTLLSFLISLALADGHRLEPEESAALQRIADGMGINANRLRQLLSMMQAQERFHYRESPAGAVQNYLEEAYRALGVNPDCSDQELKRAYRKLMSENHPDKLMARGVPDTMIKLATEKSQEIQSAYEQVRKARSAGS